MSDVKGETGFHTGYRAMILETRAEGRAQLVEKASIAVLLGVLTVLGVSDLIGDFQEGARFSHVFFEGVVFALAAAGCVWMGRGYFHLRNRLNATARELQAATEWARGSAIESARWKSEAESLIRGLSLAIEKQFLDWKLTSAETEVGFLILKGFGYKEVAELRGTSEKTVRAQSSAILAKAGLSSRSELSAFFLEDFLVPSSLTTRDRPSEQADLRRGGPEAGA